ncbi:cell surface glycoprotein CD200 receptor 1-A [Halichoeres trimaculatus]|uniref:cell surface glycoprotein CD200 receptor 1-A n=1 Tax=Halichoeres trimaculatus TaxID=147232 RepID=UPI003D9F85EC
MTCSNKTWDKILYVTWKIFLEYKKKDCLISSAHDGQSNDTCRDGKSLRNTPKSQSYLHIPNFSHEDVGVYKCQSPFKGGSDDVLINVALTVPPEISLRFMHEGNRTVAVCKAEGGSPAANISWSLDGNSSAVQRLHSPGLYTVESRLVLPEGEDEKNLSCFIRHPYWEEGKVLSEHETGHKTGRIPWLHILSVVTLTVFLASLVFIAQKKLRILRPCQPPVNPSSKSPPREDVEEVEPYASYVQRENTIYNSSADLFA